MTVRNIRDQVEALFGRIPEAYLISLVNEGLIETAGKVQHYTRVSKTDLTSYQRWYDLDDKMIDVIKVEILDTNDRYVKIPKLVDPHNLLRGDTDDSGGSLT